MEFTTIAHIKAIVHLGGLGGGGMSRTYDFKRAVRKACREEQ